MYIILYQLTECKHNPASGTFPAVNGQSRFCRKIKMKYRVDSTVLRSCESYPVFHEPDNVDVNVVPLWCGSAVVFAAFQE